MVVCSSWCSFSMLHRPSTKQCGRALLCNLCSFSSLLCVRVHFLRVCQYMFTAHSVAVLVFQTSSVRSLSRFKQARPTLWLWRPVTALTISKPMDINDIYDTDIGRRRTARMAVQAQRGIQMNDHVDHVDVVEALSKLRGAPGGGGSVRTSHGAATPSPKGRWIRQSVSPPAVRLSRRRRKRSRAQSPSCTCFARRQRPRRCSPHPPSYPRRLHGYEAIVLHSAPSSALHTLPHPPPPPTSPYFYERECDMDYHPPPSPPSTHGYEAIITHRAFSNWVFTHRAFYERGCFDADLARCRQWWRRWSFSQPLLVPRLV